MRRIYALAIGAALFTACAGSSTDEQGLNPPLPDLGPASGGAFDGSGGAFDGGQPNPTSGDVLIDAPDGPLATTTTTTIHVYLRFEDQIRTDFRAAGVATDKIDCVSGVVATRLRAADRNGLLSDGPDLTVRTYYRTPEMTSVLRGCEIDLAVLDRLPSG